MLSYCRQKLNSNLSFSIQRWIGLFVHLLFCSLKLTKNKYWTIETTLSFKIFYLLMDMTIVHCSGTSGIHNDRYGIKILIEQRLCSVFCWLEFYRFMIYNFMIEVMLLVWDSMVEVKVLFCPTTEFLWKHKNWWRWGKII